MSDPDVPRCLTRCFQVSLLAVDEMHMNMPHLTRDIYWDDAAAQPPYTLAAADYCIPSFLGSTTDMGYAPPPPPFPSHKTQTTNNTQPQHTTTTHTSQHATHNLNTQHLNTQYRPPQNTTPHPHPYKKTVVRSS